MPGQPHRTSTDASLPTPAYGTSRPRFRPCHNRPSFRPCSTLSLFHEDEIEVLLCGSGERWTMQVLSDAIKFDHGYTASSQPVR